jgi:hypothetical protein
MPSSTDVTQQVNSYILAFQSQVVNAINAVQSAATLPYLSFFDFSNVVPPDLTTISPIDIPFTNVRPISLDLSREKLSIYNLDNLPQLKLATEDMASLDQISTDEFQAFNALVMDFITSVGQNISPAVQDAIFNSGIERARLVYQDALDMAGARTGSKGFRYPNSMTKAFEKEVTYNYTNQLYDVNREIIKTMGDLAQKNIAMAVSAGVETNKALTEIAIKNLTYLLEAQRLVLDKFKVEQEAYTAQFNAQMQAIITSIDAQIKEATFNLEKQKLDLEAQRVTATIAIEFDKLDLEIARVSKEIIIAVDKLHLEAWKENANILLEKGKAVITEMVQANLLKMEGLKSIAETYSKLMTSLSAQSVSIVTQRAATIV